MKAVADAVDAGGRAVDGEPSLADDEQVETGDVSTGVNLLEGDLKPPRERSGLALRIEKGDANGVEQ